MFLSNLSIKRPVVATVMMLTLVTLGLFSVRRLPIDLMPDVEIPVLSILTEFPGASPDSVEREVSRKIEEAVNAISGVKHVSSVSREGLSSVVAEFNLEVKINDVSQEARAKISSIRRELPAGMGEPVIQKLDFNALPVISLAIRSTGLPPRELTRLADRKIKRRLESVPGVAKAKLIGSSTREVAIDLDPIRLQALGMGVDEVIGGLASENVNTPLGRLTLGLSEMPLRMSGKPRMPDQYAAMVIGRRGALPIRLGDVATVRDTIEERRSLAVVDGEPAVAIDVTKQTRSNTVDVVDAVIKAVALLQQEMPAGTRIQIVRDTSGFIRESVADVENSLILGGLLTVVIVFLFLNSWRSTIITGLTLPISVISSFIVMYFLGMTLNTLTLMALSLAIGLLIDDAIVVRENIVRHLERGEDHFTAAREGTTEIGLAVLATSMSIIAVFVPVAFMKGVIGRFFFQFGLTVAFAVLVSLFVSFTLDPMLSSRWHDPDIERAGKRNLLQRALDRFNDWFERMAEGYKGVIAWALDHRKTIVLAAVAAFVAGIAVFGTLQTEFQPTQDQSEFMLKFKSAPGSSINETRGRLEAVLKALAEFKEVRYTYASIGAGDADTVRDAMVFVKLVPRRQRSLSVVGFTHEVRERLVKIPGMTMSILRDPRSFQKAMVVVLQGDEISTLKRYAADLKRELATVRGIVDIEAAGEQDTPEYRLVVDRERAAASGLGSGAVARAVASLVGGEAVTTYEDDEGEAVNVRVRLPQALRGNVGQVSDLKLTVPGPQGPALVPLADLVTFTRATSPAEISRRDLARQVTVDTNLDGLPLGTAGAEATKAVSRINMPPGYRAVIGGDTEIMIESFGYLGEALLLAVIFVYLILAAQFESFIDPLSIMLSLPLSIVGMAGMLALTGDTLSIMSMIGLIMLMGLVTKNAILLIDYTKVLRRGGMDRRSALITAGRTRLRPILMTTLAMIFGMLPLFFGLGEGAEFRAPMARAVVGGLITSTLLTLIVVPVVYAMLDDVSAWLFGRRRQAAATAVTVIAVSALLVGAPSPAQAGPQGGPQDGPVAAAIAKQAGQSAAPVPAAGRVRVLTLADALRIAAEQNRDIQKAMEYRNWVQGRYLEERSSALPQATFKANLLRNYDDSQSQLFKSFIPSGGSSSSSTSGIGDIFGGRQDVRSADVTVKQVVFTWGQVGAAVRAAKLGFEFSDAQIRRFRQAVAKDVATAFWDVLAARELETIASQDLAQKERHLAQTALRQTAGTATEYDVLAAKVVVANARPAVIRGHNLVRAARDRLGLLLADTSGEIDVDGTLGATPDPPPAYAEVLAAALKGRPELREIDMQQGIYGELVTIAKAGDKPRLDFSATWGKKSYGLKTLSSSGTLWNAGLFATIPLFDGQKTKGRVAQAKSELASITVDELKLREAITLQVRTAVDDVVEATEILVAVGGTAMQAERLVFLAEKGYEFGVKTRLDVQDAELNLATARANLARAQRDYRVARLNLDWVAGTIEVGAAAPHAPSK
ncbi:MAG: efflux RND transporter permease subunit [Acidobacteriota bacterium]